MRQRVGYGLADADVVVDAGLTVEPTSVGDVNQMMALMMMMMKKNRVN